MDFIVADDDHLVSLEEALAFIDACDVNESSFSTGLTPRSSMQGSPLDLLEQVTMTDFTATKTKKRPPTPKQSSPASSDGQPKKKRTRSANSSSTRLQQRKRAEIQALKEQVQELESQVNLLKKNKFLPGDVVLGLEMDMSDKDQAAIVPKDEKPPSNWHEMAISQYKERLLSEKTNRRLKSILANQEKVNDALNGLLQKRSVLHGMDYVFSAQPGMENPLLPSDTSGNHPFDDSMGDNKAVMAELEAAAQRLYMESKLHNKSPNPVISCDMRIKQDARRGKMIEFVTTTPMTCSVDEASDILWKELTTYREYPDKQYRSMQGSKPNTQEKKFVMTVRSPSGMLELSGLQFLQKFDELDRSVFVVAERMLLPSKGLQFRDECWMTVTPSDSGASKAVVEIYLQLYMERDDGMQASPDDIAYAQNIVLGSLSNTFRKTFQAQQNALMEKAGRFVVHSSSKRQELIV